MAGIFSQGGSAGHRYAGWLSEVEAKNFQFGGKVFNGSPSAIYVGSNLVWMSGWLTKAAKQAIFGAFGQTDGMAVINATNAYLSDLAASDRDKATALAALINEDPMMVCSLGLEVQGVTMPIRWIENGSGSATELAYINTGFNLTSDLTYKVEGRIGGFGVHTGAQSVSSPALYISLGLSAGNYIAYITSWIAGLACSTEYAVAELTSTQLLKKDANGNSLLSTSRGSTTISRPLYIFASNGSSGLYTFQSSLRSANFKNSSKEINLIPFKKQGGECGMLDLNAIGVEGVQTFYGNANSSGSFTIPDISYTPSTP